jgi:hypothetical protein
MYYNLLCLCQLFTISMLFVSKSNECLANILFKSLVFHLNLKNIPILVFMLSVQLLMVMFPCGHHPEPQYFPPVEKRLSCGRIHSIMLFRASRFTTLTCAML